MPTEVEECPQPENAAAAESGPLAAAEQQPMVRSSSSPDVTEPLCSEAPPGTSSFPYSRGTVDSGREEAACRVAVYIYPNSIYFKGIYKLICKDVISGNEIF